MASNFAPIIEPGTKIVKTPLTQKAVNLGNSKKIGSSSSFEKSYLCFKVANNASKSPHQPVYRTMSSKTLTTEKETSDPAMTSLVDQTSKASDRVSIGSSASCEINGATLLHR